MEDGRTLTAPSQLVRSPPHAVRRGVDGQVVDVEVERHGRHQVRDRFNQDLQRPGRSIIECPRGLLVSLDSPLNGAKVRKGGSRGDDARRTRS